MLLAFRIERHPRIDQDHRPRAPASPAENARWWIDHASIRLGPFDRTVMQRFSGSIAISSAHVAPCHDPLLAPDESLSKRLLFARLSLFKQFGWLWSVFRHNASYSGNLVAHRLIYPVSSETQ